jgi:hypothetical protein
MMLNKLDVGACNLEFDTEQEVIALETGVEKVIKALEKSYGVWVDAWVKKYS